MMSNWWQASVLSVTHMQKSAHAMLLAYDTNSVQEYSRRTDKWKKSSWGADMLFTTANDNVSFFHLHSLT